ncbi:DMT family transporter [Candidatus Magnetaquicoccus inordinatus]|uniref:DMT family transporter n=1 Tax=Candidatus Magnetaquicoccus inordinatus TaxID=2496818 RepID=UPI00223934D9|nr:DMT family transporter [Candidatus Magnetaquicoccus inordinatus]
MAIQWSQLETGYQFAVVARMAIGSLLFLLLLPWMQRRPAPPRQLFLVAMVSGTSLFLSMSCVYWAALLVPSGLISVLFSLGPMLTGIMAAAWLGEPFPPAKMAGSLFGVGGVMVLFANSNIWGSHSLLGIAIIILSVVIYSAGNIAIKHWNHNISPLWVAAGSIWAAFPLFLAWLLLSETPLPKEIGMQSTAAILYLGVVANGIGFIGFFYLLSRVSAANATLVTLTAPAVGLWIGSAFNQEEIHGSLLLGTALILGGLSLFHWGFSFSKLYKKL